LETVRPTHEAPASTSNEPGPNLKQKEKTGPKSFRMNANGWLALTRDLYDKFSSGAAVILYDMGLSYGSAFMSSLDRRPSPKEIETFSAKSGWGEAILSGDLEFGAHLTVTIRECIFCSDYNDEDKNANRSCDFMKGVVTSLAQFTFNKSYKDSAKCFQNYGNEHVCKFELFCEG
jgi:predicted hydrocarbon binding protein